MDRRETTLEKVAVQRKSLDDYRSLVDDALIEEAQTIGEALKGLRVLHVNSTASGGGVAELLNSIVPLEVVVGLDVEWRLLCPDEDLFKVTKGFHNALQGQATELSQVGKETYLARNDHCAAMLSVDDYDVVIIHDPQPAALPHFMDPNHTKWVWRCHVDSSQPDQGVWGFLRPYIEQFDAAVFTMQEFVHPDLRGPELFFIPPAIDPLSAKNRPLPMDLCRAEVAAFGIDVDRPLILQVSRFDPWKDPLGVIDAYRLVKRDLPQVQLALVGAMAGDDPQGWEVYNRVRDQAGGDRDVHILTNLNGIGSHEVNAFQRVADVAVQKSIREGFGLVVSEAVWKGTPVVAGDTGGIPLQIQNSVGGFLVDSVAECAERTFYLLAHPDEARRIANRGRQRISERFLTPRLLVDELRLLRSIVGSKQR